MPSRGKRAKKAKKAQRDRAATQAFFEQASPSPAICESCAGPCGGHVKDPSENDSGVEAVRARLAAVWQEHYDGVPAEKRKEIKKALEKHPVTVNLESGLKALRLAYKQMKDAGATLQGIPPTETFDLDKLDKVAKEYEELCDKYHDEEEREMAQLAELVRNSASIASDTKRSSEDRLAAKLDIQIFNARSKLIVPLTSCLRQTQLFNVEKKFGFLEESYQALSNDDKKRRGLNVPTELPLSIRQKWIDLVQPIRSTQKPPQEQGKKKLNSLEALAELQRNIKLATEELQNDGKDTSDTGNLQELLEPAPSTTYSDTPIPEDIPDHVRQHFIDADFASKEFKVLYEQAFKQLLDVRSAFVVWQGAGQEIWARGKNHIHEMPLFRQYEYTRISMCSLLYIVFRQEVKIVEFYNAEGAPEFPKEMQEVFNFDSMSVEEFEKEWEERYLEIYNAFPSVDKLIASEGQKTMQ